MGVCLSSGADGSTVRRGGEADEGASLLRRREEATAVWHGGRGQSLPAVSPSESCGRACSGLLKLHL